MADLKIGEVTHYYDKLHVAVVDLTADLHLGDHVRFTGSQEFSQTVDSLQAEHEQLQEAHAGDTVGLQVIKPVKPGDEVLKIT